MTISQPSPNSGIRLENLTVHKMKLTVITPVFIGGGEDYKLGKTRYILESDINNKIPKKLHILDEGKWADFISKRKNLFDEYLKFIQRFSTHQQARRGQPPPKYQGGLYEWLSEKGFKLEDYKNCIKYSVDASQMEKGHDLICFIKDSNLNPYFPGSSIKGAIRTAVLFQSIKDNPSLFGNQWNEIKKAVALYDFRDIKRELNKIINRIEISAFRTLEYQGEKAPRSQALNDIFKGMYISDSQPITPKHLTILPKRDITTKEQKNRTHKTLPLPIYREYLKPASETTFTVTLDNNIVKGTRLENINDILGDMNEFSDTLLNLYQDFAQFGENFTYPGDFAVNKKNYIPNLCIGGGSGFLSKVVIHALAPNKEEGADVIRKFLDKSFRQHKHGSLDGKISPRTLKIAEYASRSLIVGWCSVQELE